MLLNSLLALALLIPLIVLLESTHRRTSQLPRAPFGADLESEASSAYRRQVAELRQLEILSSHQDEAKLKEGASSNSVRV